MKILFVHQNFPGQFLHLAPELERRGHEVRALTDAVNNRQFKTQAFRYKFEPAPVDPGATRLGRNYTTMSDRGVVVARACLQLREKGYMPDVVFGHSGWGETLFLKEVWPEAKLIVIQPYDNGMIRAIEKAIQHSDIGINPNNDGRIIRLAIPPLTEERRRDLVKVVHTIACGASDEYKWRLRDAEGKQ